MLTHVRKFVWSWRMPLAIALVAACAFVLADPASAATLASPSALRLHMTLLQETIQLPPWFIGAAPALAYAINYVILRMGGDAWSPGQKANVAFSVNATLFAALVLTGQIAPPSPQPTDGLIGSWVVYVGAWFGYVHKGSNAIADVFKAIGAAANRL